jgi:putative tricarboxylic transport membrane protein
VFDALRPAIHLLRRPILAAGLAALAAGSAPALAQSTPPLLSQLRIIAPAAPGGGWDQTARVMQIALQQAGIVRTAPVENIPGAAGTIGLARFIGAERGNGDAVLVSGLIMLGGIVTNQSPVSLGDATPLARLTGEYEAIVVPAASPYQSLQELLAAFKERPEAISWGGGSAGGSDQILAGLIAEAVGISPARVNYIAFSGGGESLSAIVGGQVTAGINGLAELAAQIEAGTVRALAISSGERLPGLAVPTLREQGVDVEFENWRSVMAPPGLDREQRERLEATIQAMVQSAPWRAALERYRWIDRYLAGDAFARYVDAEEARVRAILRQFGTGEAEARTLMSAGPYPLVVLAGLLIFTCLAVVHVRTHPAAVAVQEPVRVAPVAWLAAGILAYLLLAERGGFVVASAALFWFTARAFDSRRPYRDAAFAIVISVSAFLLFARVLQLSLPAGILAGWL